MRSWDRRLVCCMVSITATCGGGASPEPPLPPSSFLVIDADHWDMTWVEVRDRADGTIRTIATHPEDAPLPGAFVDLTLDGRSIAHAYYPTASPDGRILLRIRYGEGLCDSSYRSELCTFGAYDDIDRIDIEGADFFELAIDAVELVEEDADGWGWWRVRVPASLLHLAFDGDVLRSGVAIGLCDWRSRSSALYMGFVEPEVRLE